MVEDTMGSREKIVRQLAATAFVVKVGPVSGKVFKELLKSYQMKN